MYQTLHCQLINLYISSSSSLDPAIASLTFLCFTQISINPCQKKTHPEIPFTLLGKLYRKLRGGYTPWEFTRVANCLFKRRFIMIRDTYKTVNGFVSTSASARVTPIEVPKCGGLVVYVSTPNNRRNEKPHPAISKSLTINAYSPGVRTTISEKMKKFPFPFSCASRSCVSRDGRVRVVDIVGIENVLDERNVPPRKFRRWQVTRVVSPSSTPPLNPADTDTADRSQTRTTPLDCLPSAETRSTMMTVWTSRLLSVELLRKAHSQFTHCPQTEQDDGKEESWKKRRTRRG